MTCTCNKIYFLVFLRLKIKEKMDIAFLVDGMFARNLYVLHNNMLFGSILVFKILAMRRFDIQTF